MTAGAVLRKVLAVLPPDERNPLIAAPDEKLVPATAIYDADWLDEQIRLRGERWQTNDRKVLATLWWYSASVWLQVPSLASIAVTGRALSPALDRVSMHWLPDSRITGATSSAVLAGDDQVAALGSALRDMFGTVIPVVARAGGMKERPLWAIAADSLAGRLLWVERAIGAEATELAPRLAAAIGPEMLKPRFEKRYGRPVLRRSSCCLLYRAPNQGKCSECPKRVSARL